MLGWLPTYAQRAAPDRGRGESPRPSNRRFAFGKVGRSGAARQCRAKKVVLRALQTAALSVLCATGAFAEPVDDIVEACTQTSSSFSEIKAFLSEKGWKALQSLPKTDAGAQLAVAQIGFNVNASSSDATWKNAMQLRSESAAAMVGKPNSDFYQSELLQWESDGLRSLLLVTSFQGSTGMTQIHCQFAGHEADNPGATSFVRQQIASFTPPDTAITHTHTFLPPKVDGAQTTSLGINILDREKVEAKLGYGITADFGVETKLTIRPN